MKNKKVLSEILTFVIIFVILIISVWISENFSKLDKEQNTYLKYEKLNIKNDELNIFYLDVGQGDCTFITMNNCNMLIDAGNEEDGYYILEFLKSQNVTEIDYFVLTHADEDHIGGADEILKELEIGALYMPEKENDTKVYEKLLHTIGTCDINVQKDIIASRDAQYAIGDASWSILGIDTKNNLNDSSIIVELEYYDTKYLFMGDATSKIESLIDLEDIDVLKVAHHGSASSTSQDFLDKTSPEYAVISVGKTNSHELPDEKIIDRLYENDIDLYTTSDNGTIWISSDGTKIDIDTIKYNLDGN